jgi:hypothetical protein
VAAAASAIDSSVRPGERRAASALRQTIASEPRCPPPARPLIARRRPARSAAPPRLDGDAAAPSAWRAPRASKFAEPAIAAARPSARRMWRSVEQSPALPKVLRTAMAVIKVKPPSASDDPSRALPALACTAHPHGPDQRAIPRPALPVRATAASTPAATTAVQLSRRTTWAQRADRCTVHAKHAARTPTSNSPISVAAASGGSMPRSLPASPTSRSPAAAVPAVAAAINAYTSRRDTSSRRDSGAANRFATVGTVKTAGPW